MSTDGAIITIQLGQCGNQVGAACFDHLSRHLLQPVESLSATSTQRRSSKGSTALELTRPSQRSSFQRSLYKRFFRETVASSKSNAAAAATAGGDESSAGAERVPIPMARAVLVDMEPKVIQAALTYASNSPSFRYSSSNSFYRQSGSGNNWAFGFGVHGPQCREQMMDRVRREVERADSLAGFIIHQSLAGGTGSGVGAYLTECVRDTYPKESLLNQAVWPYQQGEVIVQNYNALLTLSHLNEHSDGVILFQNDALHEICQKRLHVKTPTFAQINSVLAENFTQVLLPTRKTQATNYYQLSKEESESGSSSSSSSSMSGNVSMSSSSMLEKKFKTKFLPPNDVDLLRDAPPLAQWLDSFSHLFPLPSMKFSTVKTIPQVAADTKTFQVNSWNFLLKYLMQMYLTGVHMEDGLNFSLHSFTQSFAPTSSLYAQPVSIQGTSAATSGLKNAGVNKRRWFAHFSSSTKSTFLFDAQRSFEASSSSSSTNTAATIGGSAGVANATQIMLPPPPAPSYMQAYVDGESYLETRMRLLQLEQQQQQQPPSDNASNSHNVALASLLFLRGSHVCSADTTAWLDPSLYASGALNPLMVTRDATSIYGHDRTAALWSNSAEVRAPLENMLNSIYSMLDARAYIHHYEKYGIDAEWMWQQVAGLEQVSADYEALKFRANCDANYDF